MPPLALATTVHDSDGHLRSKLDGLLAPLASRFGAIAVTATSATHPEVLTRLERTGASIHTEAPHWDLIGRHRRDALRRALADAEGHILFGDLDHVLRWVETDPAEFDGVLAQIVEADCTVIGRSSAAKASLPQRLAQTEGIVNHVYMLITERRWDLMMAARGLSRRAAQLIVDTCTVDTVGNDVSWPLLCERARLSMAYVEVDGLTYRTDRDWAGDLPDRADDDPAAWAMRVRLAGQCMDAMLPYMSEVRARS